MPVFHGSATVNHVFLLPTRGWILELAQLSGMINPGDWLSAFQGPYQERSLCVSAVEYIDRNLHTKPLQTAIAVVIADLTTDVPTELQGSRVFFASSASAAKRPHD
ncbi:hypothetical protein [Deinococcus maricopensis]|uniref:hypothetical protein n=1 Tax=Deinococcus maricopensis TaxID=309887 RepID=UPI0011D1EB25|nr:hypothetical protein [Deinococcus maricopensis]